MSTFRFGSHLPVLIKCVEKTNGAVLELGCGESSTIYLHWATLHKKRKLVSMEMSIKYYEKFLKIRSEHHKILYIPNWHKADVSGDWSVVLLDQSPGRCRGRLLPRFINAEYVVCHDSQSESYCYDFSKFKYRFDYKPEPSWLPQTTVVSNIHKLDRLME